MTRFGPAWLAGLVTASVLAAPTAAAASRPAHELPAPQATCPDGPGADDNGLVDAMISRAVEASGSVPHTGQLAMASFGERGPQVTKVEVTRGVGSLRYTGGGTGTRGWEIGRADGTGFFVSSSTLLHVGGVERAPTRLDRLRTKYDVRRGHAVLLDTGPADVLQVYAETTGRCRERLYVDHETGLIVRRETFDLDGNPVRVVAYTALVVGERGIAVPTPEAGVDQVELPRPVPASDGDLAPEHLPEGYELQVVTVLAEAPIPTVHLLYSDGLYTLSVFHQRGRLAPRAVRGAIELTTVAGGAVWRFPGSEPRQMVWTGDGTTFTALSDAPTDELLLAIDGLPTDPPPSILDRLARGFTRVGRWFLPSDRSDM